jgi:hypothetical protein
MAAHPVAKTGPEPGSTVPEDGIVSASGTGVPMSCLADTLAAAESVVEGLGGAGFAAERISILFAECGSAGDQFEARHTGMPAGAPAGDGACWLGNAERVVVAGCGTLIAGGPIRAALSADAVGITERGIAEALERLGLAEHRAHRCERLICSGCVLIVAHGDEPGLADRARRIAGNAGARAVDAIPEDAKDRGDAQRPPVESSGSSS